MTNLKPPSIFRPFSDFLMKITEIDAYMTLAFIWFCSAFPIFNESSLYKYWYLTPKNIKNIVGSSILVSRFWYCVKKLCSNWNLFHTHSVIMWFPSFCDRIKWNESSDMVPFLPIFVIFTPNGNISSLSHIFYQLPRVRNTLLWVMDIKRLLYTVDLHMKYYKLKFYFNGASWILVEIVIVVDSSWLFHH